MALFRRGREPPDAAAALPLGPGERLLAWAERADGGVVVATTYGLWREGRRLGWDEVDRATWRDGLLEVTRSGEGAVPDRTERHPLPVPGDLPAQVRARVTASVAYTERHRLASGGGVRVVARRPPTGAGLVWSLVWDRPGDGADPLAREEAGRLLSAARAAAGD